MRSYIFFLIFLLSALAIVGGAHLVLYFTAIRFFGITNQSLKVWLGLAFGFLSASFITSSILVRWQDIWLTRAVYFLAGLWLGALVYLVAFSAFAWILAAFLPSVPKPALGYIVIVASLAVSAYGIWSSFNPRIKNVEITLDRLPENWRGKTVVQLSDIHLGNVFGKAFLSKVVDMANRQNPEAVFITGDLLDGMGDDLVHSISPMANLKSSRGTYFITGNHETYLPSEEEQNALKQAPMTILDDQKIDLDGLELIGISYPTMNSRKDVAAKVAELTPDPAKPSILLYHAPEQIEAISKTGVNLMLSGHTHRGQLWPFNLITMLIYKGYDYGLNRAGNMQVYTSPGTGGWGPTMRVWARPEVTVIRLR